VTDDDLTDNARVIDIDVLPAHWVPWERRATLDTLRAIHVRHPQEIGVRELKPIAEVAGAP